MIPIGTSVCIKNDIYKPRLCGVTIPKPNGAFANRVDFDSRDIRKGKVGYADYGDEELQVVDAKEVEYKRGKRRITKIDEVDVVEV